VTTLEARTAGFTKAFIDGAVVAKRNLIKIKRVPDLLVFSTMSPIMFILLFAYIFGSAIHPGNGIGYREFLIPGIFVQTVIFGSTITGAGLAEDLQKGIIDRFRSLPMSRSAVLVGIGIFGSRIVGLVRSRWEMFNQAGDKVLEMEGYGMFGRRTPAGG